MNSIAQVDYSRPVLDYLFEISFFFQLVGFQANFFDCYSAGYDIELSILEESVFTRLRFLQPWLRGRYSFFSEAKVLFKLEEVKMLLISFNNKCFSSLSARLFALVRRANLMRKRSVSWFVLNKLLCYQQILARSIFRYAVRVLG